MVEVRRVGRRGEPRWPVAGEPTEQRKDLAFRGYVSAIAARGTKLADMVARITTTGDIAECQQAARALLALVDMPNTNASVVDIWESCGCQQLLDEGERFWRREPGLEE